jgi:SIR2-like protein
MNVTSPPTNDPIFTALHQSVHAKRCVAVIGAGLSHDDYPLWPGLIETLIDSCELRPEDCANGDLLWTAEMAKNKDPDKYHDTLDDIFKRKSSAKTAYRYHMLARIPFLSYITLNFDPLLMDTLDLHSDVCVSEYPNLKSRHIKDRELYYLHGRLGPDKPASKSKFILTKSEFKKAYNPSTPPLNSFLQETFTSNDVCFIGCNPTEAYIQNIIKSCEDFCEYLHGLEDPRRPVWYLLWDGDTEPPNLSQTGIHVIKYPKIDMDFHGLDDVLTCLANKTPPSIRKGGVESSPFTTQRGPDR